MSKTISVSKERVSVPENYTTEAGEDKTFWHDVAIITTFHKEDGTVSKSYYNPATGCRAQIFPMTTK